MLVNITWVIRGTNTAACIGLDEKGIEVESIEQAKLNALVFGDDCGVDLSRFDVQVEPYTND